MAAFAIFGEDRLRPATIATGRVNFENLTFAACQLFSCDAN
jgi:hypothetical protein